MDLFEKPLFAAALPDASTVRKTDSAPQQHRPSQHAFVFHEESSAESRVREMTRQQWEILKPLIRRVYIEENKPFPYLARILREEHHFEPTKRQFSRQVDKWGFRKNVSSTERRRILQGLVGGMNEAVSELQDRRLKAAKLENWKRRYREDMSEPSSIFPQTEGREFVGLGITTERDSGAEAEFPISKAELSISELDPTAPREEFTIANAESRYALQSQEKSIAPEFQENSRVKLSKLVPEDAFPMDICQDLWPFDWSTVDVPGSPGLSRLFRGLEIESAAHMPQLFLDETESDEPSCVSPTKIQKAICGKSNTLSRDCLSGVEWFSTPYQESLTIQHPQYPWRNIENVYCGYSENPLTEIYVFPPSFPRQHFRKVSLPKTPWTDLMTHERELEIRFAKLRAHFPEDHPALIAMMENLTNVLERLEKYSEAERIERKLLDIYRRKLGPSSITVLDWSSRLADLLRIQGHFTQAQHFNDSARSAITRLIEPNHPVAIRVATNDGRMAARLGRYEDSARLRREVLQITLSTYGPRHWKTIEAISELGLVIYEQQKRGADMLLRTAVQLSLEELHECDDTCYVVMINLAVMLNSTGASDEGYKIATKALEQFSPVLGRNQRRVLNLEEERAWSMLELGKLAESETLFRDLLSRRDGANLEDLANTYCGLANVLLEAGRFEEATGWFERSLHHRVEIYGANNPIVIETSRGLSECYEAQGRFDDARKVIQIHDQQKSRA